MDYDYDDSCTLCADHGGDDCTFYDCPVYIECLRLKAKERDEYEKELKNGQEIQYHIG